MKCANCEYRLWHLHSRACPECGTPFRPSEHEFTPNSVAFCCPHCDQSYFGIAANGHLTPRAFDCVNCGAYIDMDEMVLRPATELSEEQTQPDRNPWVDRAQQGSVKAWFKTLGMGMVLPGRLMRATPSNDGVAASLGFAFVTCAIMALGGFGVTFVLMLVLVNWVMGVFAPHGAGSGVVWEIAVPLALFTGAAIIAPLIYALIWAAITHGLLHLGGQPSGKLGRTLQSLYYTSGANIFGIVPCVGGYLLPPAWIWWIVSACIGVKNAQRVSGGRASFAVLTFPLVTLIGVVGTLTYMANNVPGGQAMTMSGVHQTTNDISIGFIVANSGTPGSLPDHALDMIDQGHISDASDLLLMRTNTYLSDVPVGSSTLDQFQRMAPAQKRTALQAARRQLPPNDQPYRFGDVVFTHRGINPQQHPSDLWVAIVHPDPQLNPHMLPPYDVGIVRLNGNTAVIPHHQFTQALNQENQRRGRLNLPTIPDPAQLQQLR